MKKILHILVFPMLAGSQRIALEIFKGLPDDEYEKWALFSNDSDDEKEKQNCKSAFESVGVKVLFSKQLHREVGISDLAAMMEIYQLCRKEKFNIVHTHSTKPGIIGRIAATMAGVPLVVHTVHGLAFHPFVKFPKWQFFFACEMFASLSCHKIVIVNKYYGKYFKCFKRKISIIYNGIDFPRLPAASNKPAAPIKILFVGRLDVSKDPITLLQAAKKVLKTTPDTLFTIVGNGEKYDECKTFINENHLGNNIRLEGWQTDTAKYYQSHHIFAASSIYESFGLMFVEAGYHKLPCVATDVEGIPEVVQQNVTGLLSPCKNPDLLAQNLLHLIQNEKLRTRMGEAGYTRVTSLFSSLRMQRQYAELYACPLENKTIVP
ncbi:MAG: glycosyltransferase family 4 protein [Dysgonamonadaceae bacterium]|jgi:glycosyltransferase involved in cell wall biosynthesis|nr:glycosyltransferase family 4 protein [Dysgonamonadaceae bacterium]